MIIVRAFLKNFSEVLMLQPKIHNEFFIIFTWVVNSLWLEKKSKSFPGKGSLGKDKFTVGCQLASIVIFSEKGIEV